MLTDSEQEKPMMMIIANPLSGGGTGEKYASAVEAALQEKGVLFSLKRTQYRGHAVKLAQEAAEQGCEAVVALGGDGTFQEVVTGLGSCKATVGFIAAGTGNDFIRTVGLPKDPLEALEVILQGNTCGLDLLECGDGNRCLNIAGTGLDVELLMRSIRYRKHVKSSLSYYLSLIVTLFSFSFRDFTVRVDGGEEKQFCAMMISAANGRYCGGGLPVAPEALCNDGKIDLIIIRKLPRILLPYLFVRFLKGELLSLRYAQCIRCEQVEINMKQPLPFNVDGELIDGLPFTARVLPNAVRMFCKAERKIKETQRSDA